MEVIENPCSVSVGRKPARQPPAIMPKSVAVLKAAQETRLLKKAGQKPLGPKPPVPKNKPQVKFPHKRKPFLLENSKMSSVLPRNNNSSPKPTPPPIPKPRKRGLPPPKPTPYRQHVVNKVDEVSTFKSSLHSPGLPKSSSEDTQLYASIEEKSQYRKSLKGEPSEEFFNPSQTTPEPVAYNIPIIPIETRPRLNTPHQPSEPELPPARLARAPRLSSTTEEEGRQNETTPHSPLGVAPVVEARSRHSASGAAAGSKLPSIDARPRLQTPAVPPDPDKVLQMSSKAPAPASRTKRRQPPPKPIQRTPLEDSSSDSSKAALGTNTEHSTVGTSSDQGGGMTCDDSHTYAVVDEGTKRAVLDVANTNRESPLSPASSSKSSGSVAAKEVMVNEQLVSDTEYNVTQRPGRPLTSSLPSSPPTLPPALSLSDEYSVTSHTMTQSTSQVSKTSSQSSLVGEYSPLLTTPTNSFHSQDYTVIQGAEDGYSKLPTSPVTLAPVEGYDVFLADNTPTTGTIATPSPAIPGLVQDHEYAVVTDIPRMTPPVRPTRKSRPEVTSSPKPPTGNPPKKPVSRPEKNPRGNFSSSSPPSRTKSSGPPVPISPKPARRLPPSPKATPKAPRSPNLGGVHVAKPPVSTRPKPPPLVVPRSLQQQTSSDSPKVNENIDRMGGGREGLMAERPSSATGSTVDSIGSHHSAAGEELGKEDNISDDTVPSQDSLQNKEKRRSYENQPGPVGSPSHAGSVNEPLKRRSYDNLGSVSSADVGMSPIPPGTPPPEDKLEPPSVPSASYTAPPLSPSEVFTVPQHAVPGPLNYCEVNMDNLPNSTLATPPNSAAMVSENGEVVVASSNMYPNSQGYFDLEIKETKQSSRASVNSAEEDDLRGNQENVEASASAENEDLSEEAVGISEHHNGELGNGSLVDDDLITSPLGTTSNNISMAAASLVTSSDPTEATPTAPDLAEHEGDDNDRGNSVVAKPSSPQSTKTSNFPSTESPSSPRANGTRNSGKQYGPRRALSAKRRPPPPPPPPSTPRPSIPSLGKGSDNQKQMDNQMAKSESHAVRTGLATLPRAKRTGGGAPPPRASRPPPPPVPYGAQKKTRSHPPPPPNLIGSSGNPLPNNSAPVPLSPSSSSSPSSATPTGSGAYLGPPQGLVSSTDLTNQPKIKKKLMGFFKMSASEEPTDFTRQISLRRSKKKNKGKLESQADGSRADSFTKTLPRNMGSSVHTEGHGPSSMLGAEFSCQQSEDLEFGIYSTVGDTRQEMVASTPPPAARTDKKDVHSIESRPQEKTAAYNLVQSEGGIIDARNRPLLQKSSSVEHLYEATPFSKEDKKKKGGKSKGTKSSNNSPHIVRKFPEGQQQELKLGGSGGHIEDLQADGLYAQVMDKIQPGKKVGEAVGASMTNGNGGTEVGRENTESQRVHNGKTLVVTYHALPMKDNTTEEVISSGDIEHTVTGDAMYAMVQTTKKKKKKKKPKAKEDTDAGGSGAENGVGVSEDVTDAVCENVNKDSGSAVATEGEAPSPLQASAANGSADDGETVEPPGRNVDDERENAATDVRGSVATADNEEPKKASEKEEGVRPSEITASEPIKDKSTPPPKPRRSFRTKKESLLDSSPSAAPTEAVSGTSPVLTATTLPRMARSKRSPARQAPPPPPGRKSQPTAKPPPPPPPSDPASSGPPAFPPPPPPASKSPSPAPQEEEHMYAIVNVRRSKPKVVDANALIDMWLAEDAVSEDKSDDSTTTTTAVPKNPTKKNSVTTSSTSKANSLPRGMSLRSSLTKDNKMKKNPSLPPRHTPPPPPPPAGEDTGAVPKNDVGGAGGRKTSGVVEHNASHQFLFSSHYASNLIKVGEKDPAGGVGGDVAGEEVNGGDQDDSEGDIYSTEWETSSDEEEREEEEQQEKVEQVKKRSKTFYIAEEILTTERTYVRGLRLLDQDFRGAIRSANNAHEKPVISDENMRLILGNVGSILTLNSGLLEELETRMAMWDKKPLIGDILVGRAPYFKIYTEYISRFDNALKMLDEQKKNPLFAEVLHEFEAQPKCANIPLAGYMLDVVQRITRYKLLFADYVKHLPEDSEDRMVSEKALSIVSDAATHVNETIRQMDNFRKVMEVRKKLIGDYGDTLITPSRQLMKEGELVKFSRKEKQPRMFFLFSDILIYASAVPPTNTTYKVIKRIPLEGMKVDLIEDPEMKHAFQIISTCKSFRLEASNEKERLKWFETFEKAIKELGEKSLFKQKARKSQVFSDEGTDTGAPLGSLAPPWLPDSSVSMCQLCSYNFTMTRRRHHCRACGMIFCADCSSYYAPLKYKDNKISRICQTCYEILENSGGGSPSKRPKNSLKSHKQVSLPSVLREVRARDQSAQISGYLLTSSSKARRWKKRWFVVYNLVLFEFERHEDVSAKRSVTLPSYQVTQRQNDPLVICLRHPGAGKEYLKADSEEQLQRWMEVLKKAAAGELEDSYSLDSAHNTSTSSLTRSHSIPSQAPPITPQLSTHSEEDADQEDSDDEENRDPENIDSDGSFTNC